MRTLVLTVLMLADALAQAQEMKLPHWMLQAFAGENAISPDSTFDARMYAGFGVDRLQPNRFIGTYKGAIRLVEKDQRVDFSGWTDTTKGAMALTLSGQGKETTITYLADLRTNTAIMAVNDGRSKAANVMPLHEILLLNPVTRAPLERNAMEPTGRTRKVMGITCAERYKLEGGDTLWVYASNIPHSPFVDAWNWMPMSGESFFMGFGLLGSFGDPMPLLLTTEDLVIELTEMKRGRQPPPAYDLSAYPLADKRKRDWSHAVSSAAPTLLDALKPQSADTGGQPGSSGTGSVGSGSTGAGGREGGPASGAGQAVPDIVLPPWLNVKSYPERRLLKIPAASPCGALEEEVFIYCNARRDGGIDLESAQVLVLDEEEYVFKQPPLSPNDQLALNMLNGILYAPMEVGSIEYIKIRFTKCPQDR